MTNPIEVARESMLEIQAMVANVDHETLVKTAQQLLKSDVIVTFGNGGSYANASHLVCDLLLCTNAAKSIHAIGDNNSMFSACGNDYSFEEAVAIELERYVQGPGVKTVVLVSTSGESKNIVRAAKAAKAHGCTVVALFGEHLNRIEPYADIVFSVKGKKSGRIEAAHAAICHAIVDVMKHISPKGD